MIFLRSSNILLQMGATLGLIAWSCLVLVVEDPVDAEASALGDGETIHGGITARAECPDRSLAGKANGDGATVTWAGQSLGWGCAVHVP